MSLCSAPSGSASPGMHAFLMGSLGEHGLRRLAKVVDQAEQTVHAILLDQVCVCGGETTPLHDA